LLGYRFCSAGRITPVRRLSECLLERHALRASIYELVVAGVPQLMVQKRGMMAPWATVSVRPGGYTQTEADWTDRAGSGHVNGNRFGVSTSREERDVLLLQYGLRDGLLLGVAPARPQRTAA
jgi:hypothetical protein